MDKRHAYDWDTRIHLLARGAPIPLSVSLSLSRARSLALPIHLSIYPSFHLFTCTVLRVPLHTGPGIKAGMTWSQPATQVDMAPTFLGLAGLSAPPYYDGKSLVPLLVTADDVAADDVAGRALLPASTRAHLEALGDANAYRAEWRDAVFIEYYFVNDNAKCVGNCSSMASLYPSADANCGKLQAGANAECWANGCGPTVPNTPPAGCEPCTMDCYPTESEANNFIA